LQAVTEIFAGVRVLELAQYVFVPGSGVLLADFGAEVIKIEDVTGDAYRTLSTGDGREKAPINISMQQNNRNKRSVAVNLRAPEGRGVFKRLVESADVFVTNFRPSKLKKLRLEVEDLRAWNPNIIYVRGNGLGYAGPEADRPGYDFSSFWARGGIGSSLTLPDQQKMVRSRGAFGDHTGSISVAFGIASALFRRARTGVPSVVEASLFSTALWVTSADIALADQPDFNAYGSAERSPRYPWLQAHRTKDGRYIQLVLLNPHRYWTDFARTLELDELATDPRFNENEARIANGLECNRLISERIASRTWAEWKPRFEAFDAPWELVQTPAEAKADPQAAAIGAIVDAPMPNGQTLKLVAGPVQFDEEHLKSFRRAPHLGEDTARILKGLGMSEAEISDLVDKNVIACAPN
jgi:crotonobetainyl-CoA:carnitine CoA-transferase CaiB-like acyl-CoA transferase